jgi:hypothetical protein
VSRLTRVDALVCGLESLGDSLRGVVLGHDVRWEREISVKLILTWYTRMQRGEQNEGEGEGEGENAAARCKPRERIDDRREWGKLVHGDRQYDIACQVRYAKRPLRTHAPETTDKCLFHLCSSSSSECGIYKDSGIFEYLASKFQISDR